MKNIFLPEIQALRAIAVISIFLYHLQLNSFEGGFVGVDIFFVISGFLITKILFEKKISFYNFYLSRIKRIIPTLLFTVIIVFVFTTIIFLPEHLDHFYESIKYTLLFTSNFFFWLKSADYFNINSYFQPLLHTWSLSLEMQFYFVMPFFVFFLKKISKRFQITLSFMVIILSLFLAILFIGREQSFYLLPFRICEFFVGTIIYFLKKDNFNLKYNNFFFFISLISLFFLILNFNSLNFPGIKGFTISSFTGLFILLNTPTKFKKFINSRILQFCGLISYSFFLIHWPVIVIYKYLIVSDLMLKDVFFISLITLFFSSISYFYIENFFKKISLNNFKKILIIYPFIFLSLILSSNFILKDTKKFNLAMNSEKELIFKKIYKYNENREQLIKNIKITQRENFVNDSILIIGDSHATDIFLGVKQNSINKNTYYISNNKDCFKILSEKKQIHFFELLQEYLFSKRSVSKFNYDSCNSQIQKIEKLLKNNKEITSVIISMKWDELEIKYLPYIINKLKNYDTNIILISKRIEIPNLGMAILKEKNIVTLNDFIDTKINRFDLINKMLIQAAENYNIKYFDLNNHICKKSQNSCNFVSDKDFKYLDYSHFTLKFGKTLMRNSLNEIIN